MKVEQSLETSAPPQGEESPWPSAARGWAAAVLLALASIASQFDRTVINLTVDPLKEQFLLSDTQFSMLQGIAFGLFYTLACFPLGRMADRYQRNRLLAVTLALFSLFAMASGLAKSYAQLFLARVGVGIGEASVTPTGLSLLSDYFPPERLGRPVGLFLMSAPVGQGLAFIGGGALLHWLTTSEFLTAGLFAGLQPWQAAFIIVGFPGLLFVPLFFLAREPKRRGPGNETPLSLREVGLVLRDRRRALAPMFAGFSMVTLVSYTLFVWTPAFFQRTYDWGAGEVGLGFGLVVMIFGTAGSFFGGWMTDRISARGYLDAPLRVAAYGFVGCGVFGVLATLMPTAPLALLCLAPTIFLGSTPYPCAGAAIQFIVPNRVRGQVSAIYITILTLVGLVIGPVVVGLMTDFIFKDPADIRYSLAIVVGLPAPVMFLLLRKALEPYRELRIASGV